MTNELTHLTTDVPVEMLERESTDSPRRVLLRLFRWDEIADTPQGREMFPRGSLDGVDPTQVVIESERHGGALVGRGESLENRDDGPYLVARISATQAGRDLVELVRDGVTRAVSIAFQPVTTQQGRDGVLVRARAALRRVAILPSGAYQGAEVLELRGNDDMTDTTTPDVRQDAQETPQAPAAPAFDPQPILERMDRLDASIATVRAGQAMGADQAPGAYPILERHSTFGDAWLAATDDPDTRAELHRALADQITGDNPGLVPPQYLSRIVGLVDRARRVVGGFGGPQSLPESGMSFGWPKVDDTTMGLDLSAIVAEQLTEKSEIVSAKISFDDATTAVRTFAGGSDLSWQLLRRSSPSYRDAYLRFLSNVWAMVTDKAFATAVEAGAGLLPTYDHTADSDGSGLAGALFATSVQIEDNTGQPADVVLAASDVFTALGQTPGLVPPVYGTQNVYGTAQASNLAVSVGGLPIIHAPALTSGKMVVAARTAAAWHEDGSPFVAEADDVARLGTNVAVWSMGAAAVYDPSGLALITVTLAP